MSIVHASPNAQSKWTARHEKAALLVSRDELTDEQIAAHVGITRQGLYKWRRNPVFVARVSILIKAHEQALQEQDDAGAFIPAPRIPRRIARSTDPGVVYFLRADNGLVKIGLSSDFPRRLKEFNADLPYDLEVVALIQCGNPKETETHFHRTFARKRVRNEWFCLGDEDIADIKALANEHNG